MKTATPTDEEIALALMKGVASAVPKGGGIHEVDTFITPKMLDAFLRYANKNYTGDYPSFPFEANGIFGSNAIVIKRPGMWAASRAMRHAEK